MKASAWKVTLTLQQLLCNMCNLLPETDLIKDLGDLMAVQYHLLMKIYGREEIDDEELQALVFTINEKISQLNRLKK